MFSPILAIMPVSSSATGLPLPGKRAAFAASMSPPTSSATPATLRTKSWKFSLRATKSVSELTSTSRSEGHTSELQSLMRISYAVFCLKKKKKKYYRDNEQNKPDKRSSPLCKETDTTTSYKQNYKRIERVVQYTN